MRKNTKHSEQTRKRISEARRGKGLGSTNLISLCRSCHIKEEHRINKRLREVM